MDILEQVYWNNTLRSYALSLGLFILLSLALYRTVAIIAHRIQKIADKTDNNLDDTAAKILTKLNPLLYLVISLYAAVQVLNTNALLTKAMDMALIIAVVYETIKAINRIIDYIVEQKAVSDPEIQSQSALDLIGKIAKATIWLLGVLLILSNAGVNINSLIAGLGVGGIAVALALQNILNDLFSSFAIYFDKPFTVGDYIEIGEHSGVVKKIGIKTTRITALQGEEIVISNQELTNARVRNFKQMEERRIVFNIGIVYETSTQTLRDITGIIKKIIEQTQDTRFDRAHFISFDDWALTFEIIYYVLSADYAVFRNIHEQILLSINEQFADRNIQMAYPTQTVLLSKG